MNTRKRHHKHTEKVVEAAPEKEKEKEKEESSVLKKNADWKGLKIKMS